MRDFMIIAIIVIIIIVGDFIVNRYLSNSTNELIESLTNLEKHAIEVNKTKENKSVIDEMNTMEENWKKISKIWAIFVIHQEIDNIEQALIKAKAIISDGNIEDAIPEIETAIFFVEHVKQREVFSLQNIF